MNIDKKQVIKLLKTARGQIDGVVRMVEEDQFCPNIVNQAMAADAVLRKATRQLLRGYLFDCTIVAAGTEDEEKKTLAIDEVMDVLDKLTK